MDLDVEFERTLDETSRSRIIEWVARASLWIDPDLVERFGPRPVYAKTRRKTGNQKVGTLDADGIALWRNEPAASACWRALGIPVDGATPRTYDNGRVCHIYSRSPGDPLHYTRLGNLIVVPRTLESFTEWKPVQDLLKARAWALYGYAGPSNVPPDEPKVVVEWSKPRAFGPRELEAVLRDLEYRSHTYPYYHLSERKRAGGERGGLPPAK